MHAVHAKVFTYRATRVCDGMACRGARSVGLCVYVGRTVPTAESDSPKASITLGAYLLRRGGGAAGGGGGSGAWHSVRGGAPSGFATQAEQGVTAALGVGHDNGGGYALPPVRLELGRCPVLVFGAGGPSPAWTERGVRVRRCD